MKTHSYPHIATTTDYRRYVAAFTEFMQREGIANLSRMVPLDDTETHEEFSWRPCDCCGRKLGGNRVQCHGYNPTSKEVCGPYSVCNDCEYFAEYGQLDDMTMMDLAEC